MVKKEIIGKLVFEIVFCQRFNCKTTSTVLRNQLWFVFADIPEINLHVFESFEHIRSRNVRKRTFRTYALSGDLDQPAHSRSLSWISARSICIRKFPGRILVSHGYNVLLCEQQRLWSECGMCAGWFASLFQKVHFLTLRLINIVWLYRFILGTDWYCQNLCSVLVIPLNPVGLRHNHPKQRVNDKKDTHPSEVIILVHVIY